MGLRAIHHHYLSFWDNRHWKYPYPLPIDDTADREICGIDENVLEAQIRMTQDGYTIVPGGGANIGDDFVEVVKQPNVVVWMDGVFGSGEEKLSSARFCKLRVPRSLPGADREHVFAWR